MLTNHLIIKPYELNTKKLEAGQCIRIVLATDLHSNPLDIKGSRISDILKTQKPDIIALAGDIADASKPYNGAVQFVREAAAIASVYCVTGNHECRSRRYGEITEAFRSSGAVVLEQEYREVVVGGINLIIGGMDDPDVSKRDKPELVSLYEKTPFDLILSGHAHGGQVRIPGVLNGLYAPHQGFFPKYAGGMYKYGNKIHIVSRGVSYDPRIPRIFNPPELVVIDIIGN